ncbi:MAG: hypothetical protein ACLFRD_03600 [Nitriliruptoraceae bacterium]
MSIGPLRRLTAGVGLLALAPIAGMLITDALTPEAAALRATVVLVAVVTIGNGARVVLTRLLQRVERRGGDPEASSNGSPPRSSEQPVAEAG